MYEELDELHEDEDILVFLNRKGLIESISDKGCRFLGYSKKELIGENWFSKVIPENIRKDVEIIFREIMNGNIKQEEYFENPVITKKGDVINIRWHNHVEKDSLGNIYGVLSSGRRITSQ